MLLKIMCFLSFKPGFALQASELNEIQEHYQMQITLNASMMSNWLTSEVINSSASDIIYGPGWGDNGETTALGQKMGPGLTPIHPLMVTISPINNLLTFNKGWYLCSIPLYGEATERGNLKIWIMNEETLTATISLTINDKIGFAILQNEENAAEDSELYDNSSGEIDQNSEGASRFQLEITGLTSIQGLNGSGATESNKFPKAVKIVGGDLYYMNNYPVPSE